MTKQPQLAQTICRCITCVFVSFAIVGCEILPPKELLTTPSSQLREALGPDITPIATYGRVGWYEAGVPSGIFIGPKELTIGALILAQNAMHFRAWLKKEGRYASEGLMLPYSTIAAAYSNSTRLVVVKECEGCVINEYPFQYFLFGLLFRTASPQEAEQRLLPLLDRSRDVHLTSQEMKKDRNRVIAVVKGGWTPELVLSGVSLYEGGISGRAKEGFEMGGTPGALAGELGGGPVALQAMLVGGAIGATIGAIIGTGEEIVAPSKSARERMRRAHGELVAQSKKVPIQNWLLDAVMAQLPNSKTAAGAAKESLLYTRVDDIAADKAIPDETTYVPLFRERINHVLEVSVESLSLIATGKADESSSQRLTLVLRGGYRLLRIPQSKMLSSGSYECTSGAFPVNDWQTDDANVFRGELHRCILEIGEKISSAFFAQYPTMSALSEAERR